MFKSNLNVQRMVGTRNSWKLLDPLIWADGRYYVTVPAGMVYDFASTPWFFQRVFPKAGGYYDRASTLHDYCYMAELFDRRTCDQLFYNAMISDKVPKWKAWAMYWAVRLGGGFVWAKHKPEEVQKMRELGGYGELA